MTVAEMDMYIQSIDGMEQRVINDNVYPQRLGVIDVKHFVMLSPNSLKNV